MSSPANFEIQDRPTSPQKDPNFINQNQQEEEQQQPPQSHDPQSPKTLALDIPEFGCANPPDPQDDDPNQDDPDDVNPDSPSIPNPQVFSTPATTTFTISRRGGGGVAGGGAKRKKRNALQEKKIQKKLEILVGNLKPIPFVPVKTLDFAAHEGLFRRIGLWDFVHIQFDVSIRTDLIAQLIANFSSNMRYSYVKDARIKVSRADLARALKLPVKMDKVDNTLEAQESEESIGFVQEFVSTWLLLHGDTWMMSDDILNVIKVINEGHFEKVDWAKLIWVMVEKELAMAPNIGNCYYASHLQLLIKSQREDLFEGEPVKMVVDVKDNDEEDVRVSEELRGESELKEHNIELSLGPLDNAVKDDGEKEKNEQGSKEDDAMDCQESKEDEEQGQWLKSSMDGHFLQRCTIDVVGDVECEEMKQVEVAGEEEGKDGVDGEEEEEEGEEEEDVGFNISPKRDTLEGISSENLIAAMDLTHIPFGSEVQITDNVSSGGFLASRVDTQTVPGSSLLFSNGNGSKREIEHLENDMHHHANGGNKRMRSDEPWDMKSPSDFVMCMEQMQHLIGKARMAYEAKEQDYQEISMNQQLFVNELHQRNNMIQHLHKVKIEEQQKRQSEICRLERELYMMENLLEGYRKALKETHKAFAEYRAKCPLPEVPLYKDTGSGGLVLSSAELEKQRLKQEEEDRQNRLLIEKKVEEFESGWNTKFEAYNSAVELIGIKLLENEKEVTLLKEISAKRKVSEMSESVSAEE